MALQQLSGCPAYHFKPRIFFGNEGTLHAGTYKINVPEGLAENQIPAPKFVDHDTMLEKAKEQGGHPPEAIVHGVTDAKFALTFANPSHQWRQVSTGAAFPFWQFQGGDVFLDVTITVYVWNHDRPTTIDPLSPNVELKRQRFALVMEHELLHVSDEIAIISRWMTPQLYGDEMVRTYLSNAQPVDHSMYTVWFKDKAKGFSEWIEKGLWKDEHNQRIADRDTTKNYRQYMESIGQVDSQMRQTGSSTEE